MRKGTKWIVDSLRPLELYYLQKLAVVRATAMHPESYLTFAASLMHASVMHLGSWLTFAAAAAVALPRERAERELNPVKRSHILAAVNAK